MIRLDGISKTFRIALRPPGRGAALRSLFHRTYRDVHALEDISFSIGEGDIVGYLGPNGAGKSTTIKIMSGILVPDRGECRILGCTPWKERASYVEHIGVVFGQRSQLWWDIPVIDSFELLRDIYRLKEGDYRRSLDSLVDALSLSDLLSIPVRQLSLGQRMRCELAASLIHSPKILFLDEPTIGLDAIAKLSVRQHIKEMREKNGLTIVLTTHDMNDVQALTDRIMLIGRGKLLYNGTLSAVRGELDTTRRLTVEHTHKDELPTFLGMSITEKNPGRTVFLVDTSALSIPQAIAAVSGSLAVTDLKVEACDLEQLIAKLYEVHKL